MRLQVSECNVANLKIVGNIDQHQFGLADNVALDEPLHMGEQKGCGSAIAMGCLFMFEDALVVISLDDHAEDGIPHEFRRRGDGAMPQLSPLDQLVVSEVFEHRLGKQMTVLKQVCDRGAAERDDFEVLSSRGRRETKWREAGTRDASLSHPEQMPDKFLIGHRIAEFGD